MFDYKITENVAVISQRGTWSLELNKVSWNGRAPVYDLRKWSPDHDKMSKGISLNEDELYALAKALAPFAE